MASTIIPSKPKLGTIIFDGDDTLWKTQPLYDKAVNKFLDLMLKNGFDRDLVINKLKQVEARNVKEMGLSKERFPLSLVIVYEEFSSKNHQDSDKKMLSRIREIGESVFNQKAPSMKNVEMVLSKLKQKYNLLLFTAGDKEIQNKRVNDVGLANYFESIIITDQKNEVRFKQVIKSKRLKLKTTYMVGNSLHSDINPALNAGINAILLISDSWEYDKEKESDKEFRRINKLEELTRIFL